MSDLKQRIREIVGEPLLSGLATLTADGRPWVRYVMVVADEELTIRLATFVNARKVEQIKANPEVHLTCGAADPMAMKPYLQIEGRARLTTDAQERHALWCDMLAPIFAGPDDPNYGIVVVEPYRIEYCTPGSFEPEVWVKE